MAPPAERGGAVQVHHEGGLYKVLAMRIRKPLHRLHQVLLTTRKTALPTIGKPGQRGVARRRGAR
jgi:hypothetical protein